MLETLWLQFNTTFVCPSMARGKNMLSIGSGYDAFEQHSVLDDLRWIPVAGIAEVTAADPSKCTGGVDAFLFSDRHGEGDLRWVNLKHQEWAGMHKGIIESLLQLGRIADQEAHPEEVA